MNFIPPSFSFHGDPVKARSLKGQALQFYNYVVQQAERSGINFISRRLTLSDGSLIEMSSQRGSGYSNRMGRVAIYAASGGLAFDSRVHGFLFSVINDDQQALYFFKSAAQKGIVANGVLSKSVATALNWVGKEDMVSWGQGPGQNRYSSSFSTTHNNVYVNGMIAKTNGVLTDLNIVGGAYKNGALLVFTTKTFQPVGDMTWYFLNARGEVLSEGAISGIYYFAQIIAVNKSATEAKTICYMGDSDHESVLTLAIDMQNREVALVDEVPNTITTTVEFALSAASPIDLNHQSIFPGLDGESLVEWYEPNGSIQSTAMYKVTKEAVGRVMAIDYIEDTVTQLTIDIFESEIINANETYSSTTSIEPIFNVIGYYTEGTQHTEKHSLVTGDLALAHAYHLDGTVIKTCDSSANTILTIDKITDSSGIYRHNVIPPFEDNTSNDSISLTVNGTGESMSLGLCDLRYGIIAMNEGASTSSGAPTASRLSSTINNVSSVSYTPNELTYFYLSGYFMFTGMNVDNEFTSKVNNELVDNPWVTSNSGHHVYRYANPQSFKIPGITYASYLQIGEFFNPLYVNPADPTPPLGTTTTTDGSFPDIALFKSPELIHNTDFEFNTRGLYLDNQLPDGYPIGKSRISNSISSTAIAGLMSDFYGNVLVAKDRINPDAYLMFNNAGELLQDATDFVNSQVGENLFNTDDTSVFIGGL
jgi:hypothetical protein